MNHWLILPLLLPLAAGMVNLLLVRRGPGLQRVVSLAATVSLLPVSLVLFAAAGSGQLSLYALGDWPAPFGIVLVLDRLSALLLLVTAILALPALVFAMAGDDTRGQNFHVVFPLQLFGINGAFLTGDLFNLFVFFEVMLIASYSLALHGGGPERTRAGLHYVVLNLLGSSLFLVAVGTLYAVTGTLNMADLAVRVAASDPGQSILLQISGLLLVVVFGLKAAVLPLHLWLVPLYTSVTAPVAALFAIMTKVGVYAILRVFTLIFPANLLPDLGVWLTALALLTVLAGGLKAFASQGLGEAITGLVVVSVGTLLAGIGMFSVPGIVAALYYLPHSTFLAAGMFLLADLLAGQRGMPAGNVAAPSVPSALLGGLFFAGAVAIAGMPPLSGFIGKVLLLRAVEPEEAIWLWTVILGAGLAGLITLGRIGSDLFWKGAVARVFLPGGRLSSLAPVVCLLAMGVVMTIFAAPVCRYAEDTAHQLLAPQEYIGAVLHKEKDL